MTVVYYIWGLLLINAITHYETTKNNKINNQEGK
jgi:hypothetical protein